MATLSEHHRMLTNGVGKCSVPMWMGGLPAGFCDEERRATEGPAPRWRDNVMAKAKAGPKRPEYEPTNEREALGYFVEECGEALAAAGKTLRWGPGSINPELKRGDRRYGETNVEWLEREVADLEQAIKRLRRFCFDA